MLRLSMHERKKMDLLMVSVKKVQGALIQIHYPGCAIEFIHPLSTECIQMLLVWQRRW